MSIIAPESLNQLIGVVIVFSLTSFAGGMPPLASLDHKVIPLRYFYHASYVLGKKSQVLAVVAYCAMRRECVVARSHLSRLHWRDWLLR